MKKYLWLLVCVIVLVLAGVILSGRKSTGAAEKYKTELRAKGEKLTFAELGFPKAPENGAGLLALTNAVNRIRRSGADVSQFVDPSVDAPGRQQVVWRGDTFQLGRSTNRMPWEEYALMVQGISNELAAIRAGAELPPRWFQSNPAGYFTNFANVTKYPFVELRSAAQWLYADGIEALHADDLVRARHDSHALVQLTGFYREDTTLVAAMIRVAVAGLGLQYSWQALQHTNWTEVDLLAMQRDWERVDLLEAVETGFLGERAATEMVFAVTKREGVDWMTRLMSRGTTVSPWERIKDQAVAMMWNADEDEVFALQHHQSSLETIRSLRDGRAWPEVQSLIQSHHKQLERAIGSANGLNRFRYLLSAMVIPNATRAVQTSVRHETQRRLTVTAIALQRFHLRHNRWPEKLEELVPEFISAIPMDPMNAEPLRYRCARATDYVLYSVGEDGQDDGGDPVQIGVAAQNDFWAVRDFVWPKPAD